MGGEEVGRWVGTFACQHVYYTCTTNMSYLLFLCISVLYMVIGDTYQAVVWFVWSRWARQFIAYCTKTRVPYCSLYTPV